MANKIDLMTIGKGVAGGALGRIVTNKIAPKVPMIGSNKKLLPAFAFVLGVAGGAYGGKSLKDMADGMAIVAGTDLLGSYVPMFSAQCAPEVIQALADELADELNDALSEDNALNDNVNSGNAALNDNASDAMSALAGADGMAYENAYAGLE